MVEKEETHSSRLLGQCSPTQLAGPEVFSAADYYPWNCLGKQVALTSLAGAAQEIPSSPQQ